MEITKYIKELKNAEIEELDRGIPTEKVISILEKIAKEYDLKIGNTSTRPRRETREPLPEFNADNGIHNYFEQYFADTAPRDDRADAADTPTTVPVGSLYESIRTCEIIPRNTRIRALSYLSNTHRLLSCNDSLGGAFTWRVTPQGEEFWNRINRALQTNVW